MSDNVFKFPGAELNIEVELDSQKEHSEIVYAIEQMLHIHCKGIKESIEKVEWEHILDASFGLLITAAFEAGMHPEELEEMLHSVVVEEQKYDA